MTRMESGTSAGVSRISMEQLFHPSSIAVIGASERKGSAGRALLSNILNGGFKGRLYPVNPKAGSILGIKAYPTVEEIKEPLNLAIIAVPAASVSAVLEACGRKGIHAVIVISAGYKEAGEEGRKLEDFLKALAQAQSISVLGPNCLGLINTSAGVNLNATFAKRIPKPGNISFLSQSGALGVYALEFAAANDIGMAKFVSLGNKTLINENHILQAFATDTDTRVILAYLEDLQTPGEFLEQAADIASRVDPKPVLLLKAGTGRSGQRAAASHTGALAETSEFLGDLCNQYGVIRVTTLEEMFDVAMCLSHQPLPAGPRLAILTNAGGPSIVAADEAEREGLTLPELSPGLREKLKQFLPPAAGMSNPIDVLGDADAGRYGKALDALLESGEVDAVLTICTPQMMTSMEEVAAALAERSLHARKLGITLLTAFAHFGANSEIEQILNKAGIPKYAFAENAVRSLAAAVRHSLWRKHPREETAISGMDRAAVAQILEKAKSEGRTFLGEPESHAVLKAFGFSVVNGMKVHSTEELRVASEKIRFPVVAKIVSPDIVHKSEVHGVITGIRNFAELEAAYNRLLTGIRDSKPTARIEGVLIQEQVAEGLKTILGASRDPHFGPLLMFGLGGIYVQAIKDVRFRRAPLHDADADEMIRGIRASALLARFRNRPARDTAALKDCLLRLSWLMLNFPEISEIDLNPVFALEHGAMVTDARIVLKNQPPQ